MPKRSNPDGDSAENSPMQIKTHVGEKEVNQGVMKETKMKEVYEKTLNLLMDGAKKEAEKEKESETGEPVKPSEVDDPNKSLVLEPPEPEPGQTYLDSHGKVVGVYKAVEVDDNKSGEQGNGDKDSKKDTDEKMDEDKKENGDGEDKKDNEDGEEQMTLEDCGVKVTECHHENGKDAKDEKMEEKTEESTKDDDKGKQTTLLEFGYKATESPRKDPPPSSPAKSPYKLVRQPFDKDDIADK